MSDAVLKIGSVFDKQGIVDGMAEGVGSLQAGVAQMSTSFQDIQSVSTAAWKNISDDVKAAAGSVTDAAVKVAEATRASGDAFAEQRNALKLVRQDSMDSALATRVLAAAQEKARQTALDLKTAQEELARTKAAPGVAIANASLGALAGEAMGLAASPQAARLAAATVENTEAQRQLREVQDQVSVSTLSEGEKQTALAVAMERAKAAGMELSVAQKELGEAEEAASVEAGLSANVFIAALQRMRIATEEATADMRERLYATGKSLRGGLSIGGLSGGFGELLGIGFALDMAAEFLDKTEEVNVELGHLAEKTGIAVTQLSGLQVIVKEMHGDWENFDTALVRMQKSQVLAVQGHKQQAQAFHDIGISVAELRDLSPEELLQRIATALAGTENFQARATAASLIFRDTTGQMIPILREQGEQLTANAKKAGDLTGVTDASVAASQRWAKNMADLTAKFHSFGNVLLENAHYFVGIFDIIGAGLQMAFEGMRAGVLAAIQSVEGVALLVRDVLNRNFSAIPGDAERAATDFAGVWIDSFKRMDSMWKEVDSHFKKPSAIVETKPSGDSGLPDPLPSGKNHADQDRLRSFEQALSKEKRLHSVSIQDEYKFWEEKLAAFKKGSSEYGTVLNRLAALAVEGVDKFQEAIAKLKEQQGKDSAADAEFAKQFEHISAEMHTWLMKTEEDLTRTGERWQGYWRAVSQGQSEAATAKFELEAQALAAKHAAGGLSDLAYAEQLQGIHARQGAAELKVLTNELARLQQMAAKSPKDAVLGNLLDPKLAEQIKQLENQIAQLQAKMKQQGFGDSGAIKNEIAKPFLDAFKEIQQGWLKVQRDMILGTGNIRKDFAQMGANLVVDLAQSVEKMLAQWAVYELRTLVLHMATNQKKLASDQLAALQGLAIKQEFGLKQALIDAKNAAVSGWKAGMAMPFPVDLVMAPTLAAVGFAGAMAQFNEGGMVTEGGGMHIPILAKRGERVLSTSQTNNFERLVNNNSASSSSSRVNNVRTNVRQNFAGSKAAGSNEMMAAIRKGVRNGKLAL